MNIGGIVMAYRLDPACPLGAEIVRVVREQLTDATACLTKPGISKNERIHIGRTCCKKTRAILKLGRSADEKWYRHENRRLADAARTLSPLRDTHVLLATLDSLRRGDPPRLSHRKYTRIRKILRTYHAESPPGTDQVESKLHAVAAQLRSTIRRLRAWQPPAEIGPVATNLRHGYTRARRALRGVCKSGGAADFHEWRKATKTYFYQFRLLRATWPGGTKSILKELEELGDELGQEHDLTVFRDRLKAVSRTASSKLDYDALAHALKISANRREQLRIHAIRRGERLYVEKPEAVMRRIVQWWRLAQHEAKVSASEACVDE